MDGVPDDLPDRDDYQIGVGRLLRKTTPTKSGKDPSLKTLSSQMTSLLWKLEDTWSRNLAKCVMQRETNRAAERVTRRVLIQIRNLWEQFEELPWEEVR